MKKRLSFILGVVLISVMTVTSGAALESQDSKCNSFHSIFGCLDSFHSYPTDMDSFAVITVDAHGTIIEAIVALVAENANDDKENEQRGEVCCVVNSPKRSIYIYYHILENTTMCHGYRELAQQCTLCGTIFNGTIYDIGLHKKGDAATNCPY